MKIVSVMLWTGRSNEDSAGHSNNISAFWRTFADWKWTVVNNLIWGILSIFIGHPIWWRAWLGCWFVWILA